MSALFRPKGAHPPHSIEAEQNVLGALMLGAPWEQVSEVVTADDFYRGDHRHIFTAIGELAMLGTARDPVTVGNHLQCAGQLEEAGGIAYLGTLVSETIGTANVTAYAEIVREKSRLRQLQRLGSTIEGAVAEGAKPAQILSALHSTVDALMKATEAQNSPSVVLDALTAEQMLAPIEPETFSLPGILSEAYSLMAGALASYKSTLLFYMLIWKASGYDVLGLDESGYGAEIGKAVLLSYEDNDKRVSGKLRRVIQHGYEVVREQHGERAAEEFIERLARNFRRYTLTGNPSAGIICRTSRGIERNDAFLGRLLQELQSFAPDGVLIGLDPLRLAIVGSQNDDDGADTAVHTLNYMASAIPGSALIVASHTSKAIAAEGVADLIGAAYATSGSALYSQHARSNFHMGKLKSTDIPRMFYPSDVTEAEAAKQQVVKLTHGRNSYGSEHDAIYLRMRAGTLTRIRPREATKTVAQGMRAAARPIIEAIDRLKADGLRVSRDALESDPQLIRTVGSRDSIRAAAKLLTENAYLEEVGTTRNRDINVTDKGRDLVRENPARKENSEPAETVSRGS